MSRPGSVRAPATILAVLVPSVLPSVAWGHDDSGAAAGFVSGLAHPVSGLDHVLAMVAVGIWGAQLGAPAIWLLPVIFPAVMACGGALALAGVGLPGVETAIALSAVALGSVVLLEARPRPAAAGFLVGVFAIAHGHAHGTELPAGESGLLYSVAFVIATGLLHAAGISLGLLHRRRWGRPLLRVTGGAIVLGGLWNLVGALG